VTPILDANLKRHLKDVVLGTYLKDNSKARSLNADGFDERVPMLPEKRRSTVSCISKAA
jgi:polyphosphate kinase